MLRVLLEAGARMNDVAKEGSTALMLAASVNRSPEVIRVLIEAGADVHAVDELGTSALAMALERSMHDKVREKIVAMVKGADARVHGDRTVQ